MSGRKSIWEWSCEFVGDPASWEARGELILAFMQENGLERQDHVLNVGCGNLSEGAPLIRFLAGNRFVGIEPAGWLVEVALERMPDLESKAPVFLARTDFDAGELGRRFDFVVSHSVLSHCAHWQLPQFLAATRGVVDEGAVLLASFINDQYNSWSEEWVYPGVARFRLPTIAVAGREAGWRVEIMHDYRERMLAVAPNDSHHWLRLTAVPTPAEANEQRLAEEARQRVEREDLTAAEEARVAALTEADRAGTAEVERA